MLQDILDNVDLWVDTVINVLIVLFLLLLINVFFSILRTNLMKKAKTK
ncbi:MAG: hypothetical protein PWQ44_1585, partial [Methanolobus sp.]|nr:hypothetical protein [Methanolobus sp.]